MIPIVFFVSIEKVEDFALIRLKKRYDGSDKEPSRATAFFIKYFDSVSYKTALYLFYVVILLCTAVMATEPHYFDDIFGTGFYLYTQSVYYGLLVLVAVDKFLDLLFKEAKR